MLKKRVGFAILTHNSDKYIKDCLNSIASLEKYEIHIVIVDNGSHDNTIKIVDSYITNNNIALFFIKKDKNYGTSKTRNEAIHILIDKKVDYICVLDSDAIVNQEAIDILIDTLESNDKIMIVGPCLRLENNKCQLSARNFPTPFEKVLKIIPNRKIQEYAQKLSTPLYLNEKNSILVDYLVSACWLMKTKLVNDVGLLNERFFYAPEDCEYCLRVWKNDYEVIYEPKAKIVHYWQRESKKRFFSKLNAVHLCGLIYFFIKYNLDIIMMHKRVLNTNRMKGN